MNFHFIAHNIRSAENIGALFRTSDSLGITKLWITGHSPSPTHPKVAKTALGAQQTVMYEQVTDVADAISRLQKDGFRVVALEVAPHATPLVEYTPRPKTAILLGNELTGIQPSLIALCDDVVVIPQKGIKESLNVAIAGGIAAFWMMNHPM